MNIKSFFNFYLSKLGFSISKQNETETNDEDFESVVCNDAEEKTDNAEKAEKAIYVKVNEKGEKVVEVRTFKEAIQHYFYYKETKKQVGLVGWIIFLPFIILWRVIELLFHILIILLTVVGCG